MGKKCGTRGGPGPAQYKLPTMLGYPGHDYTKNRGPAFTIRTKLYSSPRFATPGPYTVRGVDRHGVFPYAGYTMGHKGTSLSRFNGPGANAYSPEKTPNYTPTFTMRCKCARKTKPFGPSAAEYYPRFKPLPGYTMNGKPGPIRRFVNPAPGANSYLNAYKNKAPVYTMRQKGPERGAATPGPGPKYLLKRLVCVRPQGFTFGIKPPC